ncbi:MAG: PilN domain-containing protein [Pseudomonadales bacterium]
MQNVNLLTPDLRPKREVLALRELLFGWAAFAGLLLLWSGWHGWDWWQLEQDRAALARDVQALQRANDELSLQASKQPEPALTSSVAQLRAARVEQQLLSELLATVATSDGFSERLRDLAQFKQPGLWLDSFVFADGGNKVRLTGFSETADRVPQFLAGLSGGSGFSGYNFDGFELRDADNELLRFEVTGPELQSQ